MVKKDAGIPSAEFVELICTDPKLEPLGWFCRRAESDPVARANRPGRTGKEKWAVSSVCCLPALIKGHASVIEGPASVLLATQSRFLW